MTKQDCILCAQEAEFIGVGECNHEPICYRCIYKMRVISKNNACPICKTACKQMIIMPEFQPFASIKKEVIPDKVYGDIFFSDIEGQKAFEKLTEYKCFVKVNGKPCKHEKKFPSIAFLKKHLKQDHHRHICDICFQKKTCVLQEQKLYTFNQLNKHLERGDIDEFGNIVFLHPYCEFCKKNFFDDDEFRVHINLEHITCNVCGPQYKYRYYKNYNNLETHFKMTHYICMEKDCLDKKFIAFKTAEELKLHRMHVHEKSNNKKIDIKQLCGFQYEGYNPNNENIVFKDNEGVNMEDQYLALQKSKNRIVGEADKQEDQLFDIRDFYNCGLDEDEHAQKVFSKKSLKQTKKQEEKPKPEEKQDRPETAKGGEKKKKWVSKQQVVQDKAKPSQKLQKQQSAKDNQQIMLDDLLLVQSIHWTKLTNDQFDSKLKSVVSEDIVKRFADVRREFFKNKIRVDQLVTEYFKILKPAGLRISYNTFPHFIRTMANQDVKISLDDEFLKLLKQLPCKDENSLLKTSNKYSDFFSKFLKQIQKNIENRIVNGVLSIKKPVKKDKARLFQIVGVVRRIKIHEMAKLKFALNFGIQKDTVDFLVNKVFKLNVSQIQRRLQKIENQEFLDLYVFIKYCHQAVKHTENMHIEKHKIHENILEDFLYERPYLQENFGLKKEQLKTVDQKVEFEKLEEERKMKKQLKEIEKKNQSIGFTTKANFSLQDKGDFPELVIGKKSHEEKANLKDIVSEAKSKPVTYQKKINEMFPTLGEEIPSNMEKKKSSQQSNESEKVPMKQEKTEKAWWQKINEKKKSKEEEEEPEIVKVRQGKNKKEKWVTVKMDGLFGNR